MNIPDNAPPAPTTAEAPRPRDLTLDVLRIAAVVAVVVLHVANQHCREAFPKSLWVIRITIDALVRWCVPVFVMISGALFLSPSRHISLRHLYGKNLLRVVVAFFVWSYIYSFSSINAGPWHKSLKLLLDGPSHLWYLKMIAGLYVAVPLLRAITARRTTARYFLVVSVIFSMVIPFVLLIGKQYCPSGAISSVSRFFNALNLQVTAGYSCFFVLGHYLLTYRPNPKQRRIIYVLGVVALLAIIGGTITFSHRTGKPVNWFVNYLTPTVLALSAAVFVWVTSRSIHPRGWLTRCLVTGSQISFGIYLVHQLVLRTALQHGISSSMVHPSLGIPLLALSTVLISAAAAWLLSKIPWVNRYIV